MTIGDGGNDLQLVGNAGIGVAMGNAVELVQILPNLRFCRFSNSRVPQQHGRRGAPAVAALQKWQRHTKVHCEWSLHNVVHIGRCLHNRS